MIFLKKFYDFKFLLDGSIPYINNSQSCDKNKNILNCKD